MARRGLTTRQAFATGGTAVAGLMIAASAYLAHRVTRPERIVPIAAQEIAPEVRDVTFRTDDGLTIHGWYLPHDAPRDAIVIGHGFGMNRVELLDLARGLRARGHAILLFDFRAHGISEGTRSTIGYHEAHDVAAGARFLHERPELAGLPIGALGLSMGAVATILAAAEEPLIAAVVADSAYATLSEVAAGGLRVFYRLPAFPFAPIVVRFCELFTHTRIGVVSAIAAIGAIAPRPLLLIHGGADRLIPVTNAHALYAAAGEPKDLWIIPEIDHARAFHHAQEEYLRRLDVFFTNAFCPARTDYPSVAQAGLSDTEHEEIGPIARTAGP